MDNSIVLQQGDIVRVKSSCKKAIVFRINRRFWFFGRPSYVIKYPADDRLYTARRSDLQYLRHSQPSEYLHYTTPVTSL